MSPSQSLPRLRSRGSKRRSLVSLTPLIDVVFILLIFLMLVSNFLDRSAFEVSMGAAGDAADIKSEDVPLQLHLVGPDHAELDGVSLRMADMGRALAKAASGRTDTTVLIRSAAGVDLQTFVSAMSTARRAPGLKVFLVRNGTGK